MSLRVVGAGLGRTGTNSLKLALEQLLGGPCYHMLEVFERVADAPVWEAAIRGEQVDWSSFLSDFSATVDWPACAFWRELHAAHPDALILLSTRESGEAWWGSFENTILSTLSQPVPPDDVEWTARRAMTLAMMELRFDPAWRERDAAIAAYESHNDAVRAEVPAASLLEWQPGDGWEPICAALDVPVPTEPFPHVNTSQEFRSRNVPEQSRPCLPPRSRPSPPET